MLQAMSYSQFVGWQEYYRHEPFGEERGDLRAGIVASVLANVNRDSSKKPQPFQPGDFMPKFGETEVQTRPLTSPTEWAEVKRQAVEYAKLGSAVVSRRTNRVPVPTP